MNRILVLSLTVLVLITTGAWAQHPPGGPPPPPGDPMKEHFFPPDLVMRYQNSIGLTPDQQETIRAELKESQARFTDLQWQQQAEAEKMHSLLKQNPVDAEQALSQLDKLLRIEAEIKRIHFSLLVHIKNTLTPEQQSQLAEAKKQRPHDRQGPGHRPGEDRSHGRPPHSFDPTR